VGIEYTSLQEKIKRKNKTKLKLEQFCKTIAEGGGESYQKEIKLAEEVLIHVGKHVEKNSIWGAKVNLEGVAGLKKDPGRGSANPKKSKAEHYLGTTRGKC